MLVVAGTSLKCLLPDRALYFRAIAINPARLVLLVTPKQFSLDCGALADCWLRESARVPGRALGFVTCVTAGCLCSVIYLLVAQRSYTRTSCSFAALFLKPRNDSKYYKY